MPERDANSYLINGRRYDRVTRILDYFQTPEVVAWRVKVGQAAAGAVMRQAKRIGTLVHQYIQDVSDGGKGKMAADIEAKTAIEAYEAWRRETILKVVPAERQVYSQTYKYAGTFDDIYTDGEHTYLVDYKVARAIRPSYFLQLAAYQLAWDEMKGQPVCDRLMVVRFDKTLGIYEEQWKEWEWALVKPFLGLLAAYRYFNQGGQGDGDADAGVADQEVG